VPQSAYDAGGGSSSVATMREKMLRYLEKGLDSVPSRRSAPTPRL
jgi:hypothetical protein